MSLQRCLAQVAGIAGKPLLRPFHVLLHVSSRCEVACCLPAPFWLPHQPSCVQWACQRNCRQRQAPSCRQATAACADDSAARPRPGHRRSLSGQGGQAGKQAPSGHHSRKGSSDRSQVRRPDWEFAACARAREPDLARGRRLQGQGGPAADELCVRTICGGCVMVLPDKGSCWCMQPGSSHGSHHAACSCMQPDAEQSRECSNPAVRVLECLWADQGMLQATNTRSMMQGARSKASTPRSDPVQLREDELVSEPSSRRQQRAGPSRGEDRGAPKGWSPRDVPSEPHITRQSPRHMLKAPSRQLPGGPRCCLWGNSSILPRPAWRPVQACADRL